jgi:L-alanine-DL-glutamate epimerase-like enolase superfamily enzyme
LFAGAEIGEFESLADDPASGIAVEKGVLEVPNLPGLGVTLDQEKLRETTPERI